MLFVSFQISHVGPLLALQSDRILSLHAILLADLPASAARERLLSLLDGAAREVPRLDWPSFDRLSALPVRLLPLPLQWLPLRDHTRCFLVSRALYRAAKSAQSWPETLTLFEPCAEDPRNAEPIDASADEFARGVHVASCKVRVPPTKHRPLSCQV